MSEIKVRNDHPDPDGVSVGLVLEDGDIYPVTIPKSGHVPTQVEDGRKVSKDFRDGLLRQDGWTKLGGSSKRKPKSKAKSPEKAPEPPVAGENSPPSQG